MFWAWRDARLLGQERINDDIIAVIIIIMMMMITDGTTAAAATVREKMAMGEETGEGQGTRDKGATLGYLYQYSILQQTDTRCKAMQRGT